MGGVKAAMMESEDRGWHDSDTFACVRCVEDDYLRQIIVRRAEANHCDYCKRTSKKPIAAPFAALMVQVSTALWTYYGEPSASGVPYDEGYVVPPVSTREALMDLGLDCHPTLREDIESAFINDAWVEAAGGHWASSQPSEVLDGSWRNFAHSVKHVSRFNFALEAVASTSGPQGLSPGQLLPMLGLVIEECKLTRRVSKGRKLYRARVRKTGDTWPATADELGAPPEDKASAGRMNPAGIPYLYLAFSTETAIAETVDKVPSEVLVASFVVQHDLRIISFTATPELPSIFDVDQQLKREWLLFMRAFAKSISIPARPDGAHHIDYAPTQVVCEYLALVFKLGNGRRTIHGLSFPSSVHKGGRNLVLFPTSRGDGARFEGADFEGARKLVIKDLSPYLTAVHQVDD